LRVLTQMARNLYQEIHDSIPSIPAPFYPLAFFALLPSCVGRYGRQPAKPGHCWFRNGGVEADIQRYPPFQGKIQLFVASCSQSSIEDCGNHIWVNSSLS